MTLEAMFTDITLTLEGDLGKVQIIQIVKPVPATPEMTQPVGVDENGRLFTALAKDGAAIYYYAGTDNPVASFGQLDQIILPQGRALQTGDIVIDKDGILYSVSMVQETNRLFRGELLSSLKGADGKSAYEIALETGFVGSKAEWITSLKGKGSNYLPGDVDGNGVVDNIDAMLVYQYLGGEDVEIYLPAADVDGDGEITEADAQLILDYYIAGGVGVELKHSPLAVTLTEADLAIIRAYIDESLGVIENGTY